MIKNWFKKNKIAIMLILGLFLCLVIGEILYAFYGHRLIKAIYEGKSSIGILNKIISERSMYTLEYYFKQADATILFYAISFPFTIFFFSLLWKLYKYFFKQMEAGEAIETKENEKYIKYDILIAMVLYLICTILFFYPSLKSITGYLIGPAGDNSAEFWNMWWAHKAFSEGTTNLSFSNYIFYPEGTSMLFQDYSFYTLLLSFILRQFFNPVLVYNLLILHTFVLSGIGAFLLIKYLTKNSYFSLIGGFIFAFNPSHFTLSLYIISIASVQFIPLFVLYFIKSLRNGSKNLFLACLFFFLNSICNWYYLVFAIYFMSFSYVYLIYRRKQFILWDVLVKVGTITGSTLLIISPWLFRMVVLGLKHPEVNVGGHNFFVADTFALFIPHLYHPLANIKLFENINEAFTGNPGEASVYLGIINILIIVIMFKRIIKKIAKYLCGLFAFLILAVGSYIHVLGRTTPIVMPYEIIKYIPFLSNARCPSRIIVFVYLFWAIIITFALKYLFNAFKSSKKRNWLLTSFILLIFFDYYSVCNAMTKVYLPPCYNMIKKEDKVFGILDLPLCGDSSEQYMMYQTYHGFPIVGGVLCRKTGNSLIDYLELADLKKQEIQLIEKNVKYIVIHKELDFECQPLDIQPYKKWYKMIYEDGENIVFQVY